MPFDLTLRIRAALCLAVSMSLSACGGGGGDTDPKLALRINGQVVLTQLEEPQNADVTVSVGGRSFETTTSDDGTFEIAIEADQADADDIVSITARGQGVQRSLVELVSYLASMQSAVSQAGQDGELDAGENVRTNVTTVSTAEAALADEVIGGSKVGKLVTTGSQLGQALAAIDGNAVLDTAAAIKLIAEDPTFPLPQGQDNTLTFARDQDDRDQFIEDVTADEDGAALFESAKTAIVTDSRIVAAIDGSDLPNPLLLTTAPLGEFGPLFLNRFQALEFETDNTGLYIEERQSRTMTWSISGSQLVVVLDSPIESDVFFAAIDCNNDGTADFPPSVATTTGLTVALLGGRAASVAFAGQTTYENCPGNPSDPFPLFGATIFADGDFLPVDATQFAGRTVALPIQSAGTSAPEFANTELFNFGPTQGTTLLGEESFTWSIDDGALNVVLSGGRTVSYRKIASLDAVASDYFYDITSATGRSVGAGHGVVRDPQANFVESEVPGRYFLFGEDNPTGAFALRLDPGGQGVNEGVGIDSGSPFNQLTWFLDFETLFVQRSYDGTLDQGNCDQQSSTCSLYDERQIILVNRAGERYYWLEVRLFNADGSPIDETTEPLYIEIRREDRQALGKGTAVHRASRAARSGRLP